MKIAFCTGNIYSILISYILAKTHYKNNYKIMFISDNLKAGQNICKRLKELKIFDEIYYINDKINNNMDNATLIEDVELAHVFSFYNPYIREICNNYSGKVILTEEGMATYRLELGIEKKHRKNIDEIWISDKELIATNLLTDKVKEVRFFEEFFKLDNYHQLVEQELNYIFNYNHETIYNRIFFDQYFTMNSYLEELLFLKEIKPILNYYGIKVKKHPLNPNGGKFDNLDINILNLDEHIPWELVLINDALNNCEKRKEFLLVTISSSTVYNSIISFRELFDFKIISLNKLFQKKQLLALENNINKNKKYCILQIDSLDGLNNCLSKIANKPKEDLLKENLTLLSLDKLDKIILEYKHTFGFNLTQGMIRNLMIKYSYLNNISKEKCIYIWGLGKGGKLAYKILKDIIYVNNVRFIDSYKKGLYEDIEIISKEEVENIKKDAFILIATSVGMENIREFLVSIKFSNMNYTSIF